MRLRTGWFGIPGDMTGNESTKVHLVDKHDRVVCNTALRPEMQFQWCADGEVEGYIECKRCKRWLEARVRRSQKGRER